jgi:hypothetical protein
MSEIPVELKELEPLLNALGYKWSTHYRADENRIWCLVSISSGKAGRVGMTIEQAKEHVIGMACLRISKIETEKRQVYLSLKSLTEEFEKKL